MEVKSKRDAVVELVNKLFIYTDTRQWNKLLKDVFKEKVLFDMSSLGSGPAKELNASEICEMWKKGFEGIDHIHHQSGNFIVEFNGETEAVEAKILCYAIASHYKESAKKGKVREYVGTYELHASFTDLGWRLDTFKYNLKYITGNAELN
jgi:hypothetical protein